MNRLKKEKREIKKERERGRHVFNKKEYLKFEEYQKRERDLVIDQGPIFSEFNSKIKFGDQQYNFLTILKN